MYSVDIPKKDDKQWTASKVKQFLEASPYQFDFSDYENFDGPIIAYKEFIIYVENENKVTIGIQPGMSYASVLELQEKIRYMVDEVNIRYL